MTESPATALRARVEGVLPRGMLRWDTAGRGLLVSDAPRHGDAQGAVCALRAAGYVAEVADALLWLDLSGDAYAALLGHFFCARGAWVEAWFAEQALLAGILTRDGAEGGAVDVPLLRAAMVACGRGEAPLRAFVERLRAEDARALREGDTASCRAAAALCAHWLWTEKGIGLPDLCRSAKWDLYGDTP